MKIAVFWLFMLLLSSCIPLTATPAQTVVLVITTPTCTSPGTTQLLDVDSTSHLALYLPPCYDPQAAIPYPVLYLLPGHGGRAQDWDMVGLASYADPAIQSGEIRPLLIVMTDDFFGDISIDTIKGTLIPYIESRYPASRESRYRAIAGWSRGGAAAYLLAFQHPELFSSAGVFGNGLVSGQEDEVRAMLKTIPEDLKPRVFLNSGEDDTYMLQQARLLIPLLDEAGIEHAEIFGPGGHDGDTWLSNFPAYFRWLEAGWSGE
jgi:enterochelin esterase-like enzyme